MWVSLRFFQGFIQGFIQGFLRVPFRVSIRVFQGVAWGFFKISFRVSFPSIFRQGVIYCFRLIYGFFRVHLVFHVVVSCQEFLSGILQGFFRFHLGSFKVSFRIQTGDNKENELGFHLRETQGFHLGVPQDFIQGFLRIWISLGFHS